MDVSGWRPLRLIAWRLMESYFMNAYTPNAKCAPSRSSILTGLNSWQLEEAANHVVNFPAAFKTFPEVLQEAGYATGKTGKGWGPESMNEEWKASGINWDIMGSSQRSADCKGFRVRIMRLILSIF